MTVLEKQNYEDSRKDHKLARRVCRRTERILRAVKIFCMTNMCIHVFVDYATGPSLRKYTIKSKSQCEQNLGDKNVLL